MRTSVFPRVAVAGHSEGSLLGMLAAEAVPVDAYLSLDGAGRKAGDVVLAQLADRLASVPELFAAAERIVAALDDGETVTDVPPQLQTLFRASVQPYLISWFKYDPTRELMKLRTRVTIVQGSYDLQIPVSEASLLAAAYPGAKLVVVPQMSHALKIASDNVLANQVKTVYSDRRLPIAAGRRRCDRGGGCLGAIAP